MARALDEAYKAWKAEPFPRDSVDEELNELRTDLVVVEMWVSEAVVPFVEHTRYVFMAVDVRAGIRSIHDRAQELACSCDGDNADLAREYVAYAQRLDAVYAAFERTVRDAGFSN